MNLLSTICRSCVALLVSFTLLLAPVGVLAGDHGGGGAPEPMVFTVNLGKENYLQFGLIFEPAQPEAMQLVGTLKPKIQHQIILMMADKNVDTLRTLAGKKEMIGEIVRLTNAIIGEDEKSGIHDVLFSRFLIQ